jgi:aspartyl aminopeptidase
MYLRDLLEKIILSLGGSRLDFLGSLDQSFLISADQAHAVHPNFSEYADATNKPRINGGPVIKRAANRSYTSDADTIAVFKALCRCCDVPCQTFVNRSDLRGGSTIGPAFSLHLPVRAVDVGNPIWAMHSIRETGGVDDHAAMLAVLTSFFNLI